MKNMENLKKLKEKKSLREPTKSRTQYRSLENMPSCWQ